MSGSLVTTSVCRDLARWDWERVGSLGVAEKALPHWSTAHT